MGRILHAGQTEKPSRRNSIITSLCGVFSRKRSAEKIKIKIKEDKKPKIAQENKNNSNIVAPPPCNNVVSPSETSPQRDKPNDENNIKDDDYLNLPLPLPPSSSFHFSRSYSVAVAQASGGGASSKKLRSSMSMRLSSSMSMRLSSLKGVSGDSLISIIDKKEKKMQREDSLWKKTIILGDKCKVPDVDEDEDTIMCDEKGNRISAYHKRSPGSRQISCIDLDAVHRAIIDM